MTNQDLDMIAEAMSADVTAALMTVADVLWPEQEEKKKQFYADFMANRERLRK